jgi:hypothetical protein
MEDIGTGSNVWGTTWMRATGKDKKVAANKKRKEFYETDSLLQPLTPKLKMNYAYLPLEVSKNIKHV